jgi:Na+/H+-dicarboxylate symporter
VVSAVFDDADHDRASCRRCDRPDWERQFIFCATSFINLIKSIIAPLVFSTIVARIAGAGVLRKVGANGNRDILTAETSTKLDCSS